MLDAAKKNYHLTVCDKKYRFKVNTAAHSVRRATSCFILLQKYSFGSNVNQ